MDQLSAPGSEAYRVGANLGAIQVRGNKQGIYMALQNSGPSGTSLLQKSFAGYAERRTHAHGALRVSQSGEPELLFILDSHWATKMSARGGEAAAGVHRHCFWLAPSHGPAEIKTFAGEIIDALHIRMPSTLFDSIELEPSEADRRITLLEFESMFRDSLMEQMACAVAEELESPTPQSATLLHALIACIAARLLHGRVKTSLPSTSGKSEAKPVHEHRLSRVLRYIDGNLNADLSIHTLAGIACLSRFHFAMEFKRLTGRSPHKYISAQRMRFACSLLQQNNLRLADVAKACGFMTQASFNKAFMGSRGESPGQYRRAACADVVVRKTRMESKASPVNSVRMQSRSFPLLSRLSVQSLPS